MLLMKTINCQDLSGSSKNYLESHLKSEDFFGVDIYPEASLTIKSSKRSNNGNYLADGDITIKGITQPVSFKISFKNNEAEAKLTFDRTKHNVTYRSGNFFHHGLSLVSTFASSTGTRGGSIIGRTATFVAGSGT